MSAVRKSWIETFTGRAFYPLEPKVEDVDVRDLAHHLSMICRFTGAVREFYSVAQHCVLVSRLCDHNDALWGLLHDASEAYIADVSRPVKHSVKMRPYQEIEARLQKVICQKFGLSVNMPPSVRLADERILATEKRDLKGPEVKPWGLAHEPYSIRILPWSPRRAEAEYLRRYRELLEGDGR